MARPRGRDSAGAYGGDVLAQFNLTSEAEMSEGFVLEGQLEAAKQEDQGATLHLAGVDEKPLYYQQNGETRPVVIIVAGVHSTIYRRVEAQLRKRKIKPGQLTGEYFFDDSVEKAAACTLGWEGLFSRKGDTNGEIVPIEPTPKNIRELYKRCPWVLDQVSNAMNDHALFFEKESPESQNT